MVVESGTVLSTAVENVLINGESVTRFCVRADDAAGYVDIVKKDERGRLIPNEAGDEVRIFREYGSVEIILKKNTPKWMLGA